MGRLPEEAGERLETWIDGARWVEEDEDKLTRPEQGWLWIHRAARAQPDPPGSRQAG